MEHLDEMSEDDRHFDALANCAQVYHESEGIPRPMEGKASRPLRNTKLGQCHIIMESGDEYDGEVIIRNGIPVPHGHGVLTSACGGHSYVGGFIHHRRDGYGKLISSHFVLWCQWRMDYPDLNNCTRLDYPNGDRYSGFLEVSKDSLFSPYTKSSHKTSRFSMWAQSCAFLRSRWGELVTADGERYFGEWKQDTPHGFGCYITREGDRYVGKFISGKFHDTGTLFSGTFGAEGCVPLSGVRFKVGGGKGAPSPAVTSPNHLSTSQSGVALHSTFIFDGVWNQGQFCGEGHITLPNWTRVTAEWRGPARSYYGEVVVSQSSSKRDTVLPDVGAVHTWRECFHWEFLLCGASEEIRVSEREASAALRERFASSNTVEEQHSVIVEFLNNSVLVQNAVRVFRRCFYFFFGTCGRSGEIGAGLENNSLGWCCVRNAFWGCIHSSRGRPITAVDLELALLDIFSLTRSLQRWVHEALWEEQSSRLAGGGADTVIGRWLVDVVFQSVDGPLINLYAHVYSDECLNLDKQIGHMRGKVTLDDMGAKFARRFSEERLFDPYADAVHCINQLGLPGQTLTAKLNILMQWSSNINLSTRLAQIRAEEGMRGTLDSLMEDVSQEYQLGSTDDLLPIYQYVISQCSVRNLYAHVKMLADFSNQESFIDLSSQDNFRVTTFLICAITLIRLGQSIRDDHNVLVPASVRIERMMTVVESIPKYVCELHERLWAGKSPWGCFRNTNVTRLLAIVCGYVKYWMPHVIERACHGFMHLRVIHQLPYLWLTDTSIFEKKIVNVVPMCGNEVPAEVRWFCWCVAGSLMKAVGLQFGAYQALSSPCFVEFTLEEGYGTFTDVENPNSVVFVVTCKHFPLPSFLLYAASVLRDVL
ncbi:unnamed protein product [Phytomonas sp. EM1]|nr:unnamed protein product [Phytomonas sp. EM1]|eukprot:CCW64303.1 unnamed protein product [Phytomonas sp. isolate EM1]